MNPESSDCVPVSRFNLAVLPGRTDACRIKCSTDFFLRRRRGHRESQSYVRERTNDH